jgi:hypothetical protein
MWITLLTATMLLALASSSASAQSSYFGGSDGGMGRNHGYVPQPGYRAINHDPATGRTYARDADYTQGSPKCPRTSNSLTACSTRCSHSCY